MNIDLKVHANMLAIYFGFNNKEFHTFYIEKH